MSTRRTIAAIALAVAAPFALSACGTSFGAQTNQQYQAAVGSNLRSGPVSVYNGLFVENPTGSVTFSGALLSKENQTIESVTVDGAAKKLLSPITLEPDTLLTLGAEGEIVIRSADIAAGDYVTINFAASPGGNISIEVPVVTRTPEYADVARLPKAGIAVAEERVAEELESAAEADAAPDQTTE